MYVHWLYLIDSRSGKLLGQSVENSKELRMFTLFSTVKNLGYLVVEKTACKLGMMVKDKLITVSVADRHLRTHIPPISPSSSNTHLLAWDTSWSQPRLNLWTVDINRSEGTILPTCTSFRLSVKL